VIPGTEPSDEGTLVWPNLNGATVWFSPSYSPATGLFYVAVRETGATYFKREADYKPGTFFAGGGQRELPPTTCGARFERWRRPAASSRGSLS
jgi:alcohol dehydrogenase (cytochrome c)